MEMKVSGDSGGYFDNKTKNFNIMAIEMKIQICEI
jgi:hypothetical protein